MNNNDIQIDITVPAGAEQAYNAIGRVSDWWTRNTEGETSQLGDSFTVRFKETFATFKVTEAKPGRSYVWHVEDSHMAWLEDKTEWNNTDVIFTITPASDGSQIQLVHKGLTPKVECYGDCKSGWEHFVATSLYNLITTGAGMPEGQAVTV